MEILAWMRQSATWGDGDPLQHSFFHQHAHFIHSFVFTVAAKRGTLSLPVTKEHERREAEEFEL